MTTPRTFDGIVEREGGDKPVCVADTVTVVVP